MRRGGPFSHVTILLLGAAAALAALIAVSSGVSATNLAPRDGCGALTVPEETANLNATRGLQNHYIAVNVTLCDAEDAQQNLTLIVEPDAESGWSTQFNATGNLQIYSAFPDNSMVGFNWFNVTICDSQSACTVVSFHIWIDNVNDAPVIRTQCASEIAVQGERFQLRIAADDPDDMIVGFPPTAFAFSDDTDLFDIGADGKVDFTPTNGQVGSWAVHIFVRDSGVPQLSDVLFCTITVKNENDPPVLPPYADLAATQDAALTAPLLKAADPDLDIYDRLAPADREVLTFSDDCPLFNVVKVDGVNAQTGAPEPAGRIQFTPTNDQVGSWDCTVTVTDGGGLWDSVGVHVVVSNQNDAPQFPGVNITDLDAGTRKSVSVDNGKVTFPPGERLRIVVRVKDVDLHMRDSEPTVQVDPAEVLTCSLLATFVPAGESPPSGVPEEPTIDPNTCVSEFAPGDNEVGIFSITFTVRDNQQVSANFRMKLEIGCYDACSNGSVGGALTMRVSPSRGHVFVGTVVSFAATLTGGTRIVDAKWEFGDGAAGTTDTAEHAYGAAGTYNATLLVTDSVGKTYLAYASVVVAPVEPAKITDVNVTGTPTGTGAGVTFVVNVTGTVAPVAVNWSFGDGTNGTGVVASHTYAAEGDYNVTVTVSDATGRETQKTFEVSANRVPLPPPEPEVANAGWNPLALLVVAGAIAGLALWRIRGQRGQEP